MTKKQIKQVLIRAAEMIDCGEEYFSCLAVYSAYIGSKKKHELDFDFIRLEYRKLYGFREAYIRGMVWRDPFCVAFEKPLADRGGGNDLIPEGEYLYIAAKIREHRVYTLLLAAEILGG